MTRSGLVARVLRDRRSDTVAVDAADPAAVDPAESDGLLDDLLRRAFGLPTAPPARDTTELFAALWIHQVMADAAGLDLVGRLVGRRRRPATRSWPPRSSAAIPRSGVGRPITSSGPASCWRSPTPGRGCAPRVRDGVGPISGTPAELAGWLDDGAFARMTMAQFGPLHDLVVDLHELLAHDVYEQLVETVAAWGLVDPA